ncbi:hypothetical protein HOY82DRAFT_567914, partial [Tuber indicum]
MRHLHRLPLLFLPANLALAQILVFNETTGLPTCAYDCNPLWTAQFACSGRTSDDAVRCFCVEVGWVQGGSGGGGSGNGSGWGSCDSACGDPGGGRVRVKEWLGRVCGFGSGDNSRSSGDNNRGSGEVRNDSGGGGNGNSTRPPGDNVANITDPNGPAQGAADQATKARAWFVTSLLPLQYIDNANNPKVEEKLPLLHPRLPGGDGANPPLCLRPPYPKMGEAANRQESSPPAE